MSVKVGAHRVVDLPSVRRMELNMLDLPGLKHCMFGLLEVNVSGVVE